MSPTGKRRPPMEEESRSAEQDAFAKLLGQYDYSFSKSDIVKGFVISIEPNGAMIDIGAKTAAYLP
ncbi:MAG: hypothetical protein K2X66_11930, partial [Cyanobacteria bacterium]|nr:hypothetical protein [Cyanobacteriota bacterium]